MDLKLYYLETCPYCKKVMRFLDKYNIQMEMAEVNQNPKAQQELMEIGGKDQVPMLLIDGRPLYESSDIIAWLKENVVEK